MTQISKDKLCYYCYGCNKLEIEQFEGVRKCANFAHCFAEWYDEFRKALRGENEC